MTEPSAQAHARAARSRRASGASAVAWVTLAAFLALLALLAARLTAGQDPALRARAAGVRPAPRRVLVRRIIERRVIVHLPPAARLQPTQASQQVSSTGGSAMPLVTRVSGV